MASTFWSLAFCCVTLFVLHRQADLVWVTAGMRRSRCCCRWGSSAACPWADERPSISISSSLSALSLFPQTCRLSSRTPACPWGSMETSTSPASWPRTPAQTTAAMPVLSSPTPSSRRTPSASKCRAVSLSPLCTVRG